MTVHIQPEHNWRTEKFTDLQPETLIRLIGKTVHVGVYGNDDDSFKVALTGTVHTILDESAMSDRVGFEIVSHTDSPPKIKWSPSEYYALVTWDAI